MKNFLKIISLFIIYFFYINTSEKTLQNNKQKEQLLYKYFKEKLIVCISYNKISENKNTENEKFLFITIKDGSCTTVIQTNIIFKQQYTKEEAHHIIDKVHKTHILPIYSQLPLFKALTEQALTK